MLGFAKALHGSFHVIIPVQEDSLNFAFRKVLLFFCTNEDTKA